MLRKLSKNAKISLSVLFCFIGLVLVSYTYFATIKSNLYNYKNISFLETEVNIDESIDEIIADSDSDIDQTSLEQETTKANSSDSRNNYIGYLTIPDINLKRGFLDFDSKYNSVNYNVMLIEGSEMPDVENGNLILAAHRGNSSVSFFDKLYKLKMGAEATVTYQNKNYTYNLVESYTVPKTGKVTIRRNGEVNTLTLITCTRNDKKTQTVFIFELSNIE